MARRDSTKILESDKMERNVSQKQARNFFLRALVSVVLVALLIWKVNWYDFIKVLGLLSPLYLFVPIIGYYLNIGFSASKWKIILDHMGIERSRGRLYTIYLTGAFFGNFLPTTIGGDGYRFLKLRSEQEEASIPLFSSIVLERAYGYLTLLFLHFLLAALHWKRIIALPILILVEAGIIVLIVLMTMLWVQRGRIKNFLSRWSIFGKLEGIESILKIRNPKVILASVFLSLLFVLNCGIGLAMYYMAVGSPVDWTYILFVSTVINLAGALPITVNGLGLVEMLQVALLSYEGISIEAVFAVALISRVLAILLSLPGAGGYLEGSYREWRKSH